jgi:enoyl-[acyl-carrier protein] reductase III
MNGAGDVNSVDDKRISLVVGGIKGIGAATSRRLARFGPVFATYLRDEAAATRFQESAGHEGLPIRTMQADVSSREGVTALLTEVAKAAGRVDNIVFSAVNAHLCQSLEVSEDAWWKVLETNTAPFLWLGQRMPKVSGQGGRLIALTSPFSRRYVDGYGAVGPSKAALESLVVYLGVDLAQYGITVNAASGGLIDTPLMRSLVPENHIGAVARRTPLNRIGTPEDFAGLIAWIASAEASWMTGQIVSLDGGYFLR